ncbi:MAG: CopG family transcriptional regulator [Polaromonas sp.]|nr:MAG: CopG family transcriptional regulator [Polaromonas sp.]
MKNVTITMEDAVADWVRIEAAKRNSSVSRMLGEMVAEKMRHNDAYERAMHEWQADTGVGAFTSDPQAHPTREETYAERLDRFR